MPGAIVAQPPVALPKREGDERLTASELGQLAVFKSLARIPTFKKYPGTTVLRFFRAGQTVIRQNDAGQTAFYILTDEDVLALRRQMISGIDKKLHEVHRTLGSLSRTATVHLIDRNALARRRAAYMAEIARIEWTRSHRSASDRNAKPAPFAFARLHVDLRRDDRRGTLRRFADRFLKKLQPIMNLPRSIPIDGVSSIDPQTLSAPMHAGEVFGEMSCMNRAPRSATVVAARDCYMLEMQRNILDQLYRDPDYQVRMDEIYRRRVLEGDVRRLSIFQDLTDHEYQSLFKTLHAVRVEEQNRAGCAHAEGRLELIRFRTGAVIFDEGDEADCFYLVRSGVVQVVANSSFLLKDEDFSEVHWPALLDELRSIEQRPGFGPLVWRDLEHALAVSLLNVPEGVAVDAELRAAIRQALNQFLRSGGLHTALGKSKQQILDLDPGSEVTSLIAGFPDETDEWSGLESRAFHRAILEQVFSRGLPRRVHQRQVPRVLAYCSRGDCIGEMGVFLNLPRNATCVAYNHPRAGQELPDGPGAALPHVGFVRIDKPTFQRLAEMSPKIRSRVEQVVRQRQQERAQRAAQRSGTISELIPQEDLGLLQGQSLMLVDLDRCTRCGMCIDACSGAHSDGQTRLYLDGPRFDKYLVPTTCRQCLDPVCMVGCPVGAINRGGNGEIQIANWCIGCDLCAKQCPYGAIQMSFRTNQVIFTQDELAPGVQVEPVEKQAVVCDLCSSLPGRDPACVYVCPHDAALRVNAQDFFLNSGGAWA